MFISSAPFCESLLLYNLKKNPRFFIFTILLQTNIVALLLYLYHPYSHKAKFVTNSFLDHFFQSL